MFRKKYLLLVLLIAVFSTNVLGQERIISGVVKDIQDEPLIGVSVQVKNSNVGTVTDLDGNYMLSGVPANSVLVYSYIGMQSKEVNVGTETTINVTLREDIELLDEVVVIGYGTTTKRKSVGSISTMDMKKLEETSYMNVGQALQGQVPGLAVRSHGGRPGSVPAISIRGGATPLFVIDGVVSNEEDFNAINSNDIESISLLKDASSTAVYGSRAGDGIILITTKQGLEGKLSVNYSYNHQLSQPTVMPEKLNSYEYALMQNQANVYDGTPLTYDDDVLRVIKNHEDLINYPDWDWPNEIFKNFATEHKHNLSLRGGGGKSNYFVSLGYIDQGGIIKGDLVKYNRYNIRSNVNTKFEDLGLEVAANVNASLEKYQEPASDIGSGQGVFRVVTQQTPPLYNALNEDGTLRGGNDGANPLALIDKDNGYNKTRDKFINVQLRASWQVPTIEGLKLGVMGNYRDGDGWYRNWNYNVPLYLPNGRVAPQKSPSLEVGSYYKDKLYLEANLNYNRTFGKHGVEGTVVYNRTTNINENLSASRRDYASGAVDQIFAGSALGKDNDGKQFEGANAGYVFRAKYDYDYKYIVEFSGRYDGNDNFASNKRWGFFPAISAAWNVSEEEFMKPLTNRNIINTLKFRGSYGETGTTQGVTRFGYIPSYDLIEGTYTIGGNLVNGYHEGLLVNPDELTWYTRKSINYGLDFSSLNNRLSGTFEYFYYITSGYLMSPQNVYSQPLGKPLPQIKSDSKHRRAGFEIDLRYRDNLGKLNYQVGFNLSKFKQLWEQLDTEDMAQLKNPYTRETHRTDYWQQGLVYLSDGLFQNANEILNSPRPLSSAATQLGDIRYQDVNGDGKIDAQDRRTVGKPSFPRVNYGIDFRLDYGAWSLMGLFQGTGDRYMTFDHFLVGDVKRYTNKYHKDYWRPDNRDAMFPRVTHFQNVNGGNNNIQDILSDFYLLNARYFRLKNLQVSYNLKSKLLKNVNWMNHCKLSLMGTNLFTISDVTDYFDPEQIESQGGFGSGVQTYGYPVQRTFSFGVNIEF